MGVIVKRFVLFAFLVSLFVLIVPASAVAMTYDQAVDQLVANGYTRTVETQLNSFGTDPLLGFRLAGTDAEHQASFYVRNELKKIGLSDVRLEAVPVDAWDFKGATVKVGGTTMTASSFAGVPGTDGPIVAPLVYVGGGTSADFAAAGDVTEKLVLVDAELDDWWMNFVGSEATQRGALGVVMTYGAITYPWYAFPNALGSNDGEYDDTFVPMVYVAWQDGDAIKEKLAAGPLTVTMQSDVKITLAENGGTGYNVVGVLPGSDSTAAPVLVASHVDAHFRAGLDDTGAVTNELLMAKALRMSGTQPRRTVVFFFTCAEEYGYTDCWYDWAIGSWYAITHEHPDWAGKLAMMINLELMAKSGLPLELRGAADVMPFAEGVAAASPELTPYGVTSEPYPDTWNDGWSFNASGVPTVTVDTYAAEYDLIYHTNLESTDLVDHEYLGKVAKYNQRLIAGLDSGVLPYDLRARADQILTKIDPGKLQRGGVSNTAAAALQSAATDFRGAAWKWEARKGSTKTAQIATVNAKLLAIEKTINTSFTSRDAWDFTAYPLDQPTIDSIYLTQAIGAAQAGNAPLATKMITWYVATNWYLTLFSPEVYQQDLTRHYPDYEHVTWGAMGSPPLVYDCTDEYLQLQRGDTAAAIPGLQAKQAIAIADLQNRVGRLTTVLTKLTKDVKAL